MAKLIDSDSGKLLGTISPEDMAFIIDQLEEESVDDQEYYVDADTIDWFEDQGASPDLVKLLRTALGKQEGMDIRWKNE